MRKQVLHTLIFAVVMLLSSTVTNGQAPTLGTAANFVLFTTNGGMTNSGVPHLTHLTGNVGSNLPGSVTGFGNVDGQMHTADAVSGACAADVLLLYGQLAAATPTFSPSSPLLGNGTTLVPGVYQYPLLTAASLNLDLILDGQGNPNSLFIIKIDGAFSTNPSAKIKLINGALACNVFWQVEGMVNMASGTTMRGNIVAHNGAISMSTLDTLEGRAFSINGAVTTNSIMAYKPLGCGSAVLTGPAAPALASTAAFGVFSSIGGVTATPVTYVFGDVGSNSTTTTGFDPSNVTGDIHTPPNAVTAAAAADLTNVYNYLNALATDIELLDPANFGYDLVLTPHTYHLTGAPAILLNGSVYLNAQGNPDAVFVINMDGAFTTTTLSRVVLINGTKAQNVYWKIDGATHIFDNSLFNGTIVGAGAITLNNGDTLRGRVMTINGAVAINGSYIGAALAPCFAGPITGTLNICTGSTTTLSDTSAGGTWSSSNPLVATIGSSSGIATGILSGTTTIDYITPAGCSSTAILTVNTTPSVITGPGSVCIGSTITLNDIVPGGTWSSSNPAQATVGSASGIVTGVSFGTPTITYSTGGVCNATKSIAVGTSAGTISGPSAVCVGSSIILTENVSGGTWSATNGRATVLGGVVTGIANGIDTIQYTVTGACGAVVASKTITVNPTPNSGVISGPSSVCVASSIVLTNSVGGGIWSSSNASASVVNGTVTGITAGVDTIIYTVTSLGCSDTATKTVTVNPLTNAGTISGPSAVCVGSSIILTENVSGGTWSATNGTATVLGGVVTGIANGIDTIQYTITGACGTVVASKTITVNALPNAGIISGPSSVCVASSIVLTNSVGGGIWSSSNASASVVNGTVTGITAGVDTIMYTVTNLGCSATATKTVTVNSLTNAGIITGPSSVCVGSSIILSDIVPGGTWSATNSRATVLGGVVTGITNGIDIIQYTVTGTCGTAIASKTITVNALPNAGIISGPSSVCVASTIVLTDGVSGGIWSSSNSNASVLGGTVTGITAGVATIIYTVSDVNCSATATKSVTINPLANPGTITGPSNVCEGSTITLADAVPGGTWSSTNATAVVVGGVVTGITPGTDTINYAVSNICGTAFATKVIVVNALPNAGVITGPGSVCTGTSIVLSNAVAGGVWSSSNASATVVNGTVTGITTGIDTIAYTVSNITCSSTATKIITVNTLPSAGFIIGPLSLCVGSSLTFIDVTPGGVWSSSNASATITAAGVATGVTPGLDTIRYSVANSCGTTTATKAFTVNATPDAGSISGPSLVCRSMSVILTESVTGGLWSSTNGNASVSGGTVTGVTTGVDTIMYIVSTPTCSAAASKVITIDPAITSGTITGAQNVCIGSSITLANTATGGIWSVSNASATMLGNVVTGVTAGIDTVAYTVTAACGTVRSTRTVTVNPVPVAQIIAIHPGAAVCAGTMYQNFGAANLPLPNTTYNWTATNATVWARGDFGQYALINFTTNGNAVVTLNTIMSGTGCSSQNSFTVAVGTSVADAPFVNYFNRHFVATPNTENSYQWGYDNLATLDSTILRGEINQDYLNASPDFAHNSYWVMTTMGTCMQKTYYRAPTAVVNVNDNAPAIEVYPNPANDVINVVVSSAVQGAIKVAILNMTGQQVHLADASANRAAINVATLAAGSYIITVYSEGNKIASARFIKN